MVGWHLLLLLGVEVALYGAVGRHIYLARGWSLPCAIALPVGIYVGVRIVLVAAEFLLARWQGSPIPEALRLPASRRLAMYLRELGGWLLMFTFVLPFVFSRRSVLDRVAGKTSDDAPPVLLIHGLACNRGNWFWFRRQLEQRGFRVYTVDCTPPFTRIASYAPQIAQAVDEILKDTGAEQLVIVGHSMGGLVARTYLDQFGSARIAHVITLGAPHLGTWITRLGFSPNVRDMAQDSLWLAELRAREAGRSAQPYKDFTCVYTYHDNLVTPQTNAALPGAAHIAVSGIGHLSLALNVTVVNHVAGVLQRLCSGRWRIAAGGA